MKEMDRYRHTEPSKTLMKIANHRCKQTVKQNKAKHNTKHMKEERIPNRRAVSILPYMGPEGLVPYARSSPLHF